MTLLSSQGPASRRSSSARARATVTTLDGSRDDTLAAELRVLRDQLLRAASWTLGCDEAEDACQEALGRSWGALQHDRFPVSDLRRYTFAVFRNVLHEAWRVRERERTRVHLQDVEIEDRGADPLAALVRAEASQGLHAAIDDLPAAQRDAIVLCVLDGVSCEALASAQGVPAATLRQRKRRALRTLARELAEA
jgi:RNA polymerase sigma-70 factor, ECF subfamily